jgi:hypothetical protein
MGMVELLYRKLWAALMSGPGLGSLWSWLSCLIEGCGLGQAEADCGHAPLAIHVVKVVL